MNIKINPVFYDLEIIDLIKLDPDLDFRNLKEQLDGIKCQKCRKCSCEGLFRFTDGKMVCCTCKYGTSMMRHSASLFTSRPQPADLRFYDEYQWYDDLNQWLDGMNYDYKSTNCYHSALCPKCEK